MLHILLVLYVVLMVICFLGFAGYTLYHTPESSFLAILFVCAVVGCLWPLAASVAVFAWADKKERARGSANSTA